MQLCETSGNIQQISHYHKPLDAVLKQEISLKKRHRDARVAPHIIKRPVPFRRLFV